jgi:hypothetical protein
MRSQVPRPVASSRTHSGPRRLRPESAERRAISRTPKMIAYDAIPPYYRERTGTGVTHDQDAEDDREHAGQG